MHRWYHASYYNRSLWVREKETGIFLGTDIKCPPQAWLVSLRTRDTIFPASEKLRTYRGRLVNRKTTERPEKWKVVPWGLRFLAHMRGVWGGGIGMKPSEGGQVCPCLKREMFRERLSVSDALSVQGCVCLLGLSCCVSLWFFIYFFTFHIFFTRSCQCAMNRWKFTSEHCQETRICMVCKSANHLLNNATLEITSDLLLNLWPLYFFTGYLSLEAFSLQCS